MKIVRISRYSGKMHEREIDVTPEQLVNYENGFVLLQHAFPNLTSSEREFIKSGITAEEWDEMCVF